MIEPFYTDDAVTLYHGDCRELLPQIGVCDVLISDPPYDAQTHANARTLQQQTGAGSVAADGRKKINRSSRIEIDFASLPDVAFTAALWTYARRWAVLFCSLEMLGEYRQSAGDAFVRSGFWRRPDGVPQITGDRPAQPGEGVAILHRKGAKRWNGGGHHAYFEHNIDKERGRVHPTQKPERLMIELVTLFSDPGETILDPFCGSGTTLVAAKRLGRKGIGIERDAKYCAETVKRLRQSALPMFAEDVPLPITGMLDCETERV